MRTDADWGVDLSLERVEPMECQMANRRMAVEACASMEEDKMGGAVVVEIGAWGNSMDSMVEKMADNMDSVVGDSTAC